MLFMLTEINSINPVLLPKKSDATLTYVGDEMTTVGFGATSGWSRLFTLENRSM